MNKKKEDNVEQFDQGVDKPNPPAKVVTPRSIVRSEVDAIADRLEKQYLQGNPDIAVAEAVKALRKLTAI